MVERGAVVEWLERLGYGAESLRKAGVRGWATTGKLCQTSSRWVPFFELGTDKAAKGVGWAPPFISCAQDTPTAPTAIRLWETFTHFLLYHLKTLWNDAYFIK